ncbi:hydroxyacid oxidase 1-like [Strongylocentrotus purpuratus]|uniref:FMN hydroxy acid dehydrogenase domain-containing protein n=1 Tax=Strongylocentrotus purpuratus TaxID=7668 RepID=A0A7M7P8B5_STRPU|nr:hydroxyacid oxidase 1-like [Strongylocentrotus purpuratus]
MMTSSETSLTTIEDFRRRAKELLSSEGWSFYNDASGRRSTFRDSMAAFDRYVIRPRILRDITQRSLSTTVLGQPISMPICVAPTAAQQFAHPDAEAASAKGEAAMEAADAGVSGIIVSAHGGRHMDGVPAPIDVLAEVVSAVKGRGVEVYMDGGVRSGTDALKALGLGARAVLIGRPALWGLACDGPAGVTKVLSILRFELDTALGISGCTSIQDIPPSLIARKSYL